ACGRLPGGWQLFACLQDPDPHVLDPAGHRPRVGLLGVVGEIAFEGGDQRLFLLRKEPVGQVVPHSGMFPCLRAGTASRLVESIRSVLIRRGRVSAGSMTSSMYPRSAAT